MKNLFAKAPVVVLIALLAGCAVYVRDRPGLGLGRRGTVVAASGPRLVLVTGTSIKYCPDEDEDLFFYGGRWYAFRAGLWYHSARHSGPWGAVGAGKLPGAFVHIPMGHFKHHRGRWHPALGPGHDDEGGSDQGQGHDKDGDGEDDHKHHRGKGHGKH